MSAASIAGVVRTDLCIGCGLCESVTGGRVRMEMTAAGSLRPTPVDGFSPDEERAVLATCPGVVAEARVEFDVATDLVWGSYRSMAIAWAGHPGVRHESATGGVLTALAIHLLRANRVAFVLHVGADPVRPSRSRWVISETADEVRANSGSWYGPAAPLAGLGTALDRDQPFAIVAKPCDVGAVHRYASVDDRVDRLCVARLAMVCGGQSRLTKTLGVLAGFGVTESEVSSLRYRGNGNPGPTHIETAAGDVHELTYGEMWSDESTWDVETRCKLCPDALGECADIAAADAWPGGAPAGEDAGFNAIVVRSASGEALVEAAAAGGDLVLGRRLTPRDFDALQPHQVSKKVALAARFDGMVAAGVAPIETIGLRIGELGRRFAGDRAAERDGTRRRMTEAQR